MGNEQSNNSLNPITEHPITEHPITEHPIEHPITEHPITEQVKNNNVDPDKIFIIGNFCNYDENNGEIIDVKKFTYVIKYIDDDEEECTVEVVKNCDKLDTMKRSCGCVVHWECIHNRNDIEKNNNFDLETQVALAASEAEAKFLKNAML